MSNKEYLKIKFNYLRFQQFDFKAFHTALGFKLFLLAKKGQKPKTKNQKTPHVVFLSIKQFGDIQLLQYYFIGSSIEKAEQQNTYKQLLFTSSLVFTKEYLAAASILITIIKKNEKE